MITSVGQVVWNKIMALGTPAKWACAIGNGGSDPVYGVPIAPAFSDTVLRSQIYFSSSIDSITPVAGPASYFPRIEVMHTFFAQQVVPNGVSAVAAVDEFGVFLQDPETNLYVLLDRQTFSKLKFVVPISGPSVSRDYVTLLHTLGVE